MAIRDLIRRFKTGDLIVIFLMCCIALLLSVILPKRIITYGDVVLVESRSKLVGRYSLNKDRIIAVAGPLGATRIQIRGGKVSIVGSPCPGHYCEKMGVIGSGGGALVCVPNEIVVTIGGEYSDGVDAISR